MFVKSKEGSNQLPAVLDRHTDTAINVEEELGGFTGRHFVLLVAKRRGIFLEEITSEVAYLDDWLF